MTDRRLHIIVLFGLAALLFSVNVGGYGLWPADEPRFGQVAREMMRSGDYLAPHVNGEAYREKPPLLFWAIALVSQPFGDVTETSARIPSIVAALVTLLCTYLLAERLFDRRTALWAGIVLATSFRFWWQARTAQIDMLLTACLTAALLFFWIWHERRRMAPLLAFYACIAAAVYAKGPPGVVFPLLLITVFFWGRREERRKTHWLWGTLGVAAAIGAWLIPARMSVADGAGGAVESDIAGNLFRQTIGRFLLGVSHAQPPWYYIENLIADLMPWTLLLPFVLAHIWKQRRAGAEMRLLLAWVVPALLFFTACTGKRAVYLLPLFPAFAILIALGVVELVDSAKAVWRRRTAAVWSAFLLTMAATPFALLYSDYREAWRGTLLILSAVLLGLAGHGLYTAVATDGRRLHVVMATHMVVLECLVAFVVFPLADPYKSARGFCEPLRELSEAGREFDLFSIGFSREEYVFYSDHFHQPLLVGRIGITLPPGYEEEDAAELAQQIRKGLEHATEEIPIDFSGPAPGQALDALEEAVLALLEEHASDSALTDAFTASVIEEAKVLGNSGPAFAFIQEEDWRWLVSLAPVLREYSVLEAASVGRRNVLLLANNAGLELRSNSESQ